WSCPPIGAASTACRPGRPLPRARSRRAVLPHLAILKSRGTMPRGASRVNHTFPRAGAPRKTWRLIHLTASRGPRLVLLAGPLLPRVPFREGHAALLEEPLQFLDALQHRGITPVDGGGVDLRVDVLRLDEAQLLLQALALLTVAVDQGHQARVVAHLV